VAWYADMLTALLLLLVSSAPPDLAAVGVVVAESPERSVAILRAGGRTRVVGVGDSVFGGRLLAVSTVTVSLEFEGERVDVRVRNAGPPTLSAPVAAPPPKTPEPRREDAPVRVMKREEVQERLGREMNRILAETAIRPVTEDGRVVGVRLTRVARDSLLTEAGLRPGDVLTNINGTEIDGMATLISLWPRLQGASDLRAQGLRDGRPFSISLSLQ
jgi:general secretion pathway protein C